MTLLYNGRIATQSGRKFAPAVYRTGANPPQRLRFGIHPGEHLNQYELYSGAFGKKPEIAYLSGQMRGLRGKMLTTYDNQSTQLFQCGLTRGRPTSTVIRGKRKPSFDWTPFEDVRYWEAGLSGYKPFQEVQSYIK